MLYIIIGYDENTGKAIAGDVVGADSDRQAVRMALDWCVWDAPETVGGWRLFRYSESWGPGIEIKPEPGDYY